MPIPNTFLLFPKGKPEVTEIIPAGHAKAGEEEPGEREQDEMSWGVFVVFAVMAPWYTEQIPHPAPFCPWSLPQATESSSSISAGSASVRKERSHCEPSWG